MRRSPLLGMLSASGDVRELHEVVVRAIAKQRPGPETPAHTAAWRHYHVLTYRFVEQSTQAEVADDMCVSIRQLRRYERAAVEWLADSLWREQRLSKSVAQLTPLAGGGGAPAEAAQDHQQELAWVRESFPSAATSLRDLVDRALSTVRPLANEMSVRIECHIPDVLCPIVGQLAPLRQSLINLLSAAIRSAPGGSIELTGQMSGGGLVLLVRAIVGGARPPAEAAGEVSESLEMARQLAVAFGATLLVHTLAECQEERLCAALTLAQARESQVLFVDDNEDALRLFERYLQDTRFRMLPLREPERAADTAVEVRPAAVVLDVMLPGVDGWELLGRLREHPATRSIPVLVCTILPQEELALALGAAEFIRKPVSREELLSALARVLP